MRKPRPSPLDVYPRRPPSSLFSRLERARSYPVFELCLVCAGLLFMLAMSGEVYGARYGTTMNPDVQSWLDSARGMTWFYDTGRREPAHPFVVRLILGVVPDPEQALRLTTVLETALAAICGYAMARVLLGRVNALIVHLMFCCNPVVIFYSVSGMREPLQTALAAAYVTLLVASTRRKSISLAIGAGVVGAALVLTRTYGATLVVALVMLSFVCTVRQGRSAVSFRRDLMVMVVMLCVTTTLAIPRLFVPGDNVVNVDLMYWRGIEVLGRPGDLDTIGSITLGEFIFADGKSILQVAALYLGNIVRYFTDYLPFFLRGFGWGSLIAIMGMLISLRRALFELPLGLIASLAPLLPIMHLNQQHGSLGIESRFLLPSLPFALCLFVVAIEAALGAAHRIFGARAAVAPDLTDG
ncbi:MAG: glycosyltransferase family 39 protein [Myxococcota bacterium]